MVVKFKTRKETSEFLKTKGVDTSNWTEEKWQSINKSQAEIHMQALAEAMYDAYNESIPKLLQSGEWHIPFGDKIDSLDSITDNSPIERLSKKINYTSMAYSEDIEALAIKISTARCARLSYMNFDGEINYQKDIELHDKLLTDEHWSAFEHCARVMTDDEYFSYIKGTRWMNGMVSMIEKDSLGCCNNFRGFIQYRYMLQNKLTI